MNRVTTFGFGDIGKDEGQKFRIPLPLDFSSEVIDRRLVVTLAYFTPIAFNRQEYRHAQLWFDRVGLTKDRLVPNREYTDWPGYTPRDTPTSIICRQRRTVLG